MCKMTAFDDFFKNGHFLFDKRVHFCYYYDVIVCKYF